MASAAAVRRDLFCETTIGVASRVPHFVQPQRCPGMIIGVVYQVIYAYILIIGVVH